MSEEKKVQNGLPKTRVHLWAMCDGVITKTSRKTGNDYQVTSFVVEQANGQRVPLEVFGDLGIARSDKFQEYVLVGQIKDLAFPEVVQA